MNKRTRKSEESIIMVISALTMAAITPFAILRTIEKDWFISALDWSMVVVMAFVFIHVYKTHQTQIAKYVIGILFMAGMNVTVYLHGETQLYWTFPATVSLYFILPAQSAGILSVLGLIFVLPVVITVLAPITLTSFLITLTTTNLFSYFFSVRQRSYQQMLLNMSQKDPLTGAGNRRALDNKLNDLVYLNQRARLSATLLMIDIDKFKDINDKFGHGIGDMALKSLCQVIKYRIRFSDSLYRFGGEEFIVVAESTQLNDGKILAEQIRRVVEESCLVDGETITLSIGVAEIMLGESKESWVNRADEALYTAKNGGRNRVCLSEATTQATRQATA